MKIILPFLLLIFIQAEVLAQDVEQIARQLKSGKLLTDKRIKVTGGVSANAMSYAAWNVENRQVPFTYNLAGNLNINLFGKINMPLTFSYFNQKANFTSVFNNKTRLVQPFNRFQLQPAYKGFTLSLGTCVLNFSPYTLAGHRYDGVGLMYKSDKVPLYGGIMLGRLLRKTPVDFERISTNNRPTYQRDGSGLKLGYKKQKDFVEVIVFQASDKLSSLPYTLDSLGILPARNAVASLNAAKAMGQKLFLSGEFAVSGLTEDIRGINREDSPNTFEKFGGLLQPNASTIYKKAWKANLAYAAKIFKTAAEYSRVDPQYRTLGGYFFNNDLETFAVNGATQAFNGKLSITANVGLQQDNLDGQKLQTTRRWVGANGLSYSPNEKMNITTNFSTFQNFSNLRPQFDYLTQITPYNVLDTLDYQQINQTLAVNGDFILPSKNEKIKNNLTVLLMQQGNKDQQGIQQHGTRLYNAMANFARTLTERKLSLNGSVNYTQNLIEATTDNVWGISTGVSKGWLKDALKTHLNLLWSTDHSYGEISSGVPFDKQIKVWNLNGGMSYTFKAKHSLNLNLRYMARNEPGNKRPGTNFSELSASLGYAYNFSMNLLSPAKNKTGKDKTTTK